MRIVETKESYEKFLKVFKKEDCILIPILSDVKLHPQENSLSLLYIYFLENKEEYILPFNHSEALNLSIENFQNLVKYNNTKYTFDKKKLLHMAEFKNLYDINLQYYMATNQPFYIDDITTNAHNFFYTRYHKQKNVNKIIPIMKHLEYCRKLVKLFEEESNISFVPVNLSYNNEVLRNLQCIESSGLQTKDKGKVYSEYNIYTSTGRPSNRFGGINFAALNKTDESRKNFISRFENGVLVEFDYDAYHLRLIGDVVGYKFPKESVHKHMARFYSCDYEESKRKSFQYLYGGIPPEVWQMNPFFSSVYDYVEDLWKNYKNKDFIVSDIYNKKIYRKNLSDMNKNKVFNYCIQLLETENNMKMLSSLIPILEEYESKLILYSYDSFLFDFKMGDELDYLKKVKSIIEQEGKYPTKVSRGNNYHEMNDITEKFDD